MAKLTENDFSFKCPMNWDEMELSGGGRHCRKCAKQVFDLTNCSLEEIAVLQKSHGSICGSIRIAHVAVLAASFSAAACTTPRLTGTPGPINKPVSQQVLMGEISPQPAKP